ncbi:myotubularin-related protein 10-like isoform X2 [Ptychodera flava]|uniref:myotubularin-related protein 10-like isoform X2 n=1 Tax=Ptychodera flava TaxID=63121 RepID=UPI00396A2291
MSNKQSTFKSYVDLKSNAPKGIESNWERERSFKSYVNWSSGSKVEHSAVSKAAEDVFEKTLEPKLLAGEIQIAKAHNVLKFNSFGDLKHGMSGALFCTNFKISFVTAERSSYDLMGIGQKNILLGENDIPLTCVDAVYQASYSKKQRKLLSPGGGNLSGAIKMIEIHCKDFRVYTFSFKFSPRGEDKNVVNAILHHAFPSKLQLLFAFVFNPKEHVNSSNSPNHPSIRLSSESMPKVPAFRDAGDWDNELKRVNASGFRVTMANQDFKISDSLPEYFVVPSCLTDSDINNAAPHFIDGRVPTWCWSHNNGSSLYRMVPLRADTEFVDRERSMLKAIKDVHPKKEKSFMIHIEKYCPSVGSIQSSFKKLQELCMPESMKEFWGSDDKWYTSLDITKWLHCVRRCLSTATEAVDCIVSKGKSVILKESEGRDLSCVISSLVQLILDPYLRTRVGFESLIQREWVVMGHEFLTRCQHVSLPEGEESPVFLLFLDCVWQLVNQFPLSFSFTDTYLITLWDCSHHGLFETFIFNSERQRYRSILQEVKEPAKLVSVWDWSLQFKEEDIALFNNPMYYTEHPQHQNCVGCRNEDLKELQLKLSPVEESTNVNDEKLPYRKLSQASQISAEQRLSNSCNSDTNLAQSLNATGPAVKFWIQCYLRWIPSVHVVNGGPPTEFQQQCMLVDEIHYLRRKVHSLRTSTPLAKRSGQESSFYFTYDSSPRLSENFTSAFPFSPSSLSNHMTSYVADKSALSAVAGMFIRSPSMSSYDGLHSSGSMSSSNNDDLDEES